MVHRNGTFQSGVPPLSGSPLCLGNGGQRIANKRPKPDEIVTKSRQVDLLVRQGLACTDAIRQVRMDVSNELLAGTLRVLSHLPRLSGYDKLRILSYQIALFVPIGADVIHTRSTIDID